MGGPTGDLGVDLRFADAGDTAEILELVNDAFSVEKGDSALAFTTRDRVSKEEVAACLNGASGERRWLVLETPYPEEHTVAACLIRTGNIPGTGSVDVLAVEPARQGKGLGSLMLRRAEGILLNFRCRFVRMRVAQWRGDVLGWAAKCGYKETGGGVWGELDGQNAEDLTRPTRYFVLTRDLLTDGKVAHSFGDGTARFTAAAKRATVAKGLNSTLQPSSTEGVLEPIGESAKGKDESSEDKEGLARFLSSVLKGLVVADAEEGEEEVTKKAERCGTEKPEGVKGIVTAPMVDTSVGASTTPSCRPQVMLPSLPPTERCDKTANVGACNGPSMASSTAPASGASSVPVGEELEVTKLQSVPKRGVDSAGDGEESVEDLLSSLMRTLNTKKGRADFRLLAAAADGRT